MAMEGDADRGFERLLTRLDDATRSRYCAEALGDELRGVLAQFQQCAQAMDHARQVAEATRSLVANAGGAIRMGSATATQSLSELQGLHNALETVMDSLRSSGESAARVELTETVVEEEKAKEEAASEEVRLLEKTRSLLTKQRRSTWLSDAVETARSAVRLMQPKATEEQTRPGDKTEFAAPDLRIYEVFKLLRKCVLKDAAAHAELLPVARKLLKRLGKKRPAMAGFVDKSVNLLAAKEAKLAEKPADVAATSAAPPVKSKKRRLPETSTQTSTTTEDVKIKTEGTTRATLDVRSKAQLCSVKTSALRAGFSLTAFDVCLKMMIEVVNALTPQLTSQDTAVVSSTLASLVDKAITIDSAKQRLDRLACLEGLLGVLLRAERLEWKDAHAKTAVVECRSKCRQALAMRRDATVESASVPVSVPEQRTKKSKAVASHVKFDE